jgi:hypothetical protein
MAHRIDISLGQFSEDEHHKVRNFIEDVWANVCRSGWAEMESFDHRIKPGASFHFSFPARQSHDAVKLIDGLVSAHFMERFATIAHAKKASADG